MGRVEGAPRHKPRETRPRPGPQSSNQRACLGAEMKARSCVRKPPDWSKSVSVGWWLTLPGTPPPPQPTVMQSAEGAGIRKALTEKVVPVQVRSGAQARRSAVCTIASLVRWKSVNSRSGQTVRRQRERGQAVRPNCGTSWVLTPDSLGV